MLESNREDLLDFILLEQSGGGNHLPPPKGHPLQRINSQCGPN